MGGETHPSIGPHPEECTAANLPPGHCGSLLSVALMENWIPSQLMPEKWTVFRFYGVIHVSQSVTLGILPLRASICVCTSLSRPSASLALLLPECRLVALCETHAQSEWNPHLSNKDQEVISLTFRPSDPWMDRRISSSSLCCCISSSFSSPSPLVSPSSDVSASARNSVSPARDLENRWGRSRIHSKTW